MGTTPSSPLSAFRICSYYRHKPTTHEETRDVVAVRAAGGNSVLQKDITTSQEQLIDHLFQLLEEDGSEHSRRMAQQCFDDVVMPNVKKFASLYVLNYAIRIHHLVAVKALLVDAHTPTSASPQSSQTPALCIAAGCGNVDVVRLLLHHDETTMSPNQYDFWGMTPLHYAARGSHLIKSPAPLPCHENDENQNATIIALLQETPNNIQVDGVTRQHHITPLMDAVRFSHIGAARTLLQQGANASCVDDFGKNVLAHACTAPFNQHELVQLLIAHGARDNNTGIALQYCIRARHYHVIKTLITEGHSKVTSISLDMALHDKTFPANEFATLLSSSTVPQIMSLSHILLVAVEHGNLGPVMALTQIGIDINTPCTSSMGQCIHVGDTALVVAIRVLDFGCFQYLIHHGANYWTSPNIWTCFHSHFAAMASSMVNNNHVIWEFVKVLCHAPGARPPFWILAAAIRFKQFDVLNTLYDDGTFNINDVGQVVDGDFPHAIYQESGMDVETGIIDDDMSVLSLAARLNDIAMMKFLIARGADVNLCTAGLTSLYHATARASQEAIVLLVEHGADISAPSCENVTPLMLACELKDAVTVTTLLRLGADPSVDGRRPGLSFPLEIAMFKTGNMEVVHALLRYPRSITWGFVHANYPIQSFPKEHMMYFVTLGLPLEFAFAHITNEERPAVMSAALDHFWHSAGCWVARLPVLCVKRILQFAVRAPLNTSAQSSEM